MRTNYSTFKKKIETVMSDYNLLEEFKTDKRFHATFYNDCLFPVVVQRNGKHVSIVQYIELNGKLIPNSDFEFIIAADGEWHSVDGRYTTGHEENDFSTMWAKSLNHQNH